MADPREFWRRKISTNNPHLTAPVGVKVPIRATAAGDRAAKNRAMGDWADMQGLERDGIGHPDDQSEGWVWDRAPSASDERLVRRAARSAAIQTKTFERR